MSIYRKAQIISLKDDKDLTEKWLFQRLIEDPSLLGLGDDIVVKDQERIRQNSRLDMLLQDNAEPPRRYEVELQLGKSDPSHIIRCIEYWDRERKQYPQYDHCAVLVAEDITSRFLNVVSLFNGHIPMIAIQMTALRNHDDSISLVFTRILDDLSLGLVEDDEELSEPTSREDWVKRRAATIGIADEIVAAIQTFAEGHELNYNKHYIGLKKHDRSNNFISFRPKQKWLHLLIKLPKTTETDEVIAKTELENTYETRWRQYRINLTKDEWAANKTALIELIRQAWELREGKE